MDSNMEIPDDGDESRSNSEGHLPSSDEKRASEIPESINDPTPSVDANFEECLNLGARLWISSKKKSNRRVAANPYTKTSPFKTNPTLRIVDRRIGNLIAGDPQTSSSLVGFSNVAGLNSSTPFLQQAESSSASSAHHGAALPPKVTLPSSRSEPNLYVRQELREVKPRSDPKDLPQQPHFSDPSLGAMFQQFQNLGVSTEQSSKLGSIQPFHLARAGHSKGQTSSVATTSRSHPSTLSSIQPLHLALADRIEAQVSSTATTSQGLHSTIAPIQPLHPARTDYIAGPASSVATTRQSLQQMGPSAQASGLTVTSDDSFKSIVKTGLLLIGYMLRSLTYRPNLPVPEESFSNSVKSLLENVAFAFKTIEQHPDYNRVLDRIGVGLFTRILMRIADKSADVRVAIYHHRAGGRFDLRERLGSMLVDDLRNWYGVLEQVLNAI